MCIELYASVYRNVALLSVKVGKDAGTQIEVIRQALKIRIRRNNKTLQARREDDAATTKQAKSHVSKEAAGCNAVTMPLNVHRRTVVVGHTRALGAHFRYRERLGIQHRTLVRPNTPLVHAVSIRQTRGNVIRPGVNITTNSGDVVQIYAVNKTK